MKMEKDDEGITYNIVFKTFRRHPTDSLARVLESFDFGFLGMGWDLSGDTPQYRDLRSFLFPGMDVEGPLPLIPARRDDWANGFISQYQGTRMLGRYMKYVDYGFDLSLITPDVIAGYRIAGEYMMDRIEEDRQVTGQIFTRAADAIENERYDEIREAVSLLPTLTDFQQMLDALE